MTLLQVTELVKRFPVRHAAFSRAEKTFAAVDGVSFSVEEGESFGLVGESGCGKTTVARCIMNLIRPDSGGVIFGGRNIIALRENQLRSLRRDIQMIFQDPYGSLNPRMSAGAIVEEPLTIHRIGTTRERKQRVRELFQMVGLDSASIARYPHEFSGGQRQRIGIARAIALNPRLIVADEPVSALDVSVQAQIINLLKDLQSRLKLTFLFIAHDLSVVRSFCDRVAVMYQGKIVETAGSMELFSRPEHPYTRLLLASIPIADPAKRSGRHES